MRTTSSIRTPLVASAITTVVLVAIAACSKTSASSDSTAHRIPPRQPLPRSRAVCTVRRGTARPQRDLQWGPAPAVLPPGAEIAVLQGDPSKAEDVHACACELPNGYKIPPHTHPDGRERDRTRPGRFSPGWAPTFDESKLQPFGRDGFLSVPAEHAHYAMARGETVVQVHGLGPFALTYVNPADNPAAVADDAASAPNDTNRFNRPISNNDY